MNKSSLLLLVAAFSTAALGTAEAAPAFSVTTDMTYATDYVFRGVRNAGSSFQPSVEVAWDNFNAGVWTNQPLLKHVNNEVDYYLGYRYPVNSRVTVEGVGTYYWYPEAHPSLGQTRHSEELGAGVTYDMAPLTPSLYYYHDFRLKADTLQGSLGYSVPVEGVSAATIETSVFVGTVVARSSVPDLAGPDIREGYSYYGVDLSVPYKLTANATFTVAGHYSNTINLAGANKSNHAWMTVGITIGI